MPLAVAAYGMGFFHDISGVAFASDAIVDIIPVDTTSALTIAAAAAAASHGPYAGGHARVYHAASAASYPQRAPGFFEMLRKFWVDNPPPFALPFARQVGFYCCWHWPCLVFVFVAKAF